MGTAQHSRQAWVGWELEFAEKRGLLATRAALLTSLLQSSSGSDFYHSWFYYAIVFTRQNIPVTPAPVLGSSMGSCPTESADLIGSTGAWGKGRGRLAGLPLGSMDWFGGWEISEKGERPHRTELQGPWLFRHTIYSGTFPPNFHILISSGY